MGTPHVCPKCNGEGTSDGQPALGRLTTKCWPCGGSGVVWEPNSGDNLSNPFQGPSLVPSTWQYRGWPVQQPVVQDPSLDQNKQNHVNIIYQPCPYCQGPCKSHAI